METMIHLNEGIRKRLEKMKENGSESYEDVIMKLVDEIERKKQEELLIEGCKEMAEDMLAITKEWESTDSKLDWEWNEN